MVSGYGAGNFSCGKKPALAQQGWGFFPGGTPLFKDSQGVRFGGGFLRGYASGPGKRVRDCKGPMPSRPQLHLSPGPGNFLPPRLAEEDSWGQECPPLPAGCTFPMPEARGQSPPPAGFPGPPPPCAGCSACGRSTGGLESGSPRKGEPPCARPGPSA